MNFDQYWKYRKEKIEKKYTSLELSWLKEETKLSWDAALTNTVSMNSDAVLTSAMHSDGQSDAAEEIWTNEDESTEIERQIVEDARR